MAEVTKPNIVFVLCDNVGWGDFGVYGGGRPTRSAIPAIDFTAAHMLIELNRDLQGQGKRIVLARRVGQVRDVLTTESRTTAIEIYPSVRAAVDALHADSSTDRDR